MEKFNFQYPVRIHFGKGVAFDALNESATKILLSFPFYRHISLSYFFLHLSL